jgi:hypothetical protein
MSGSCLLAQGGAQRRYAGVSHIDVAGVTEKRQMKLKRYAHQKC